MINIFVIDDHPVVNMGIETAIKSNCVNYRVIDSATSGSEALTKLKNLIIDVIFLDIVMPEMNGVDICKEIKKLYPEIKIIAFSGENEPELFYKIWLAGADAILLKDCGTEELIKTIKSVLRGVKIISEKVPIFFDQCETETNRPKLTHLESEVLKLLGLGFKRNDVAEKMNLSKHTIDFHCKNIHSKFNSNSINEIIKKARKDRIIS